MTTVDSAHVDSAPARRSQQDDDFLGEHHVYEPHRVGLPPLGKYVRELWRRRHFATELGRTNIRAADTNTFFGQLWLVINPLLLSAVYYLLRVIIGGKQVLTDAAGHPIYENARHAFAYSVSSHVGTASVTKFFDQATGAALSSGAGYAPVHVPGLVTLAHLMAGLFAFYFVSNCMSAGANSVIQGAGLILNTAFPRLLLPISTIYIAVRRFAPTLVLLAIFNVAAGTTWHLQQLWLIVVFAEILLFASGLAFLLAAAQVYFRDTTQFLPYFIRIWLYMSPVILTVAELKAHSTIYHYELINPLLPLMGNWASLASGSYHVAHLNLPPAHVNYAYLLGGLAWGLGVLTVGSLYFMSRERDFAVRL